MLRHVNILPNFPREWCQIIVVPVFLSSIYTSESMKKYFFIVAAGLCVNIYADSVKKCSFEEEVVRNLPVQKNLQLQQVQLQELRQKICDETIAKYQSSCDLLNVEKRVLVPSCRVILGENEADEQQELKSPTPFTERVPLQAKANKSAEVFEKYQEVLNKQLEVAGKKTKEFANTCEGVGGVPKIKIRSSNSETPVKVSSAKDEEVFFVLEGEVWVEARCYAKNLSEKVFKGKVIAEWFYFEEQEITNDKEKSGGKK